MRVVVWLNFLMMLRVAIEGWQSSLGGMVKMKRSRLGVMVDSNNED